jgi:predicted transcriptional regulator
MTTPVKHKNDYSYISASHLRAARAWMGWTLDIAVEKLGISRQTLWRYEASQNKISKSSAQKIHAGFMNNGVELREDGLRVV